MGGRGDLASYMSRVWATLLDALLVVVAAFVLAAALSAAGASDDTAGTVVLLAALLGSLVYAPALMCRSGRHNGQTLGKQALGIRVVLQDASAMTARPALLREFVGKGLLGLVPFYTIVDCLFPLGDARRQAIHDKIGSTFVVHADAVPDLGHTDAGGLGGAFGAGAPERPEGAAVGWVPPTAPEPATPPDWGPPPPAGEPATSEPRIPEPAEAPVARAPEPGPGAFRPPAPAPAPPAPDDEDEQVRGPFGPSSNL